MKPLRRAYRLFVSARATVTLLCILALLLLLNVALPQSATLGEEAFGRMMASAGPWARFFLLTLGLGRMPTSPVFLGVLGLFFINLVLVLAGRVGPTLRRTAIRPRSEKGLVSWARLEESLSAPLPAGWDARHAAQTLRGFGYQVRRPGERTFFGVKHRAAGIGFLLFHLSFFLLCAGGVLIYYTRFVGVAAVSEGQEFTGEYGRILRRAPLYGVPALSFVLDSVEPRFEAGEPLHLGAVFRFRQAGSSVERRSRVNHPARWGSASVLVDRAGLTPVFWLQDESGFTVDRVAAAVRSTGDEATDVPLDGARLTARVHPLGLGAAFPSRDELGDTALRVEVLDGDDVLFDGSLRPGQAAGVGRERLVLQDLGYWVGVRVVSERGGALIIVGFAVCIVGLVWRLLLHRREVALTWEDGELRLVGRSEYFSWRFDTELRSLRDALARVAAPTEPRSHTRNTE